MAGIRITDEHNYGDRKVTVFHTEAPNLEASIALDLLQRWGTIMAEPDGEDSAGRQKGRVMTPIEVVTRAFDIAAAAMDEMEARGLLIKIPDLNEINKDIDEKRAAKKQKETA